MRANFETKKKLVKLIQLCILTMLLTQQVATSCNDKCKTCNIDGITCEDCVPGFTLTADNSCSNCSEIENCSQCKNGICQSCQIQYFLTEEGASKKCESCPDNCSACQGKDSCSSCGDFYMLNADDACIFNYFILLIIAGIISVPFFLWLLCRLMSGDSSNSSNMNKAKLYKSKKQNSKESQVSPINGNTNKKEGGPDVSLNTKNILNHQRLGNSKFKGESGRTHNTNQGRVYKIVKKPETI